MTHLPHSSIEEEAQRQAVETEDRSVVVSAGAGSGKTQVLAERFVYLVRTGKADIDQILTITYTRKAAREMKERIVALLERDGMGEARWLVESAYISTIDSLCARLIRENPFESMIDPFFQQLAEHDAKRLFYRAFDRVVDRHSVQADSAIGNLLREAFGRMRFNSDPRDALHTLRQDLYQAMETVRLFGWTREHLLQWADEITQQPECVGWQLIQLLCSALLPCVKAALRVLPVEEPLAGEVRRVQSTLESLSTEGNLTETVNMLRETLLLRQGNSHINHPVVAECLNRLREWHGLLKAQQVQKEVQQAWRTVASLHLLVEAWDEYQRVKQEGNLCDFADAMTEAVRLLRDHVPVRRRYRQRFRFVMVDEFQDANGLQLELIRLLSNGKNLFVVGDAQQSIYAFRHADVSLFRKMERRAREAPQHALLVRLQRNFRSRPEILRFVEGVYRPIWSASPGGDVYRPLHSAKQFAPKRQPSVEFVVVPAARDDALWVALARATAEHIRRLVDERRVCITAQGVEQGQPLSYRHLAILLRQTSQVPLLEEALSRAGVPFYNTARRQYFVQPEVRDLIFALTVIDAPTNDVALAATLRSPVVGVSMDTLYNCALEAQKQGRGTPLWLGVKRWLQSGAAGAEADIVREFVALVEDLQQERTSLDVAQTLANVIHRTRYEARLLCRPDGKQRVANVRKLLQMAMEDREMSVAQFVEIVDELERIALREGEAPVLEEMADVVRIYTVHGAKGLQFPVVVLPDVARPVRRRPQPKLLSCLPAQRFIAQGFSRQPAETPLALAEAIWLRQREWEEELRVWYVAMTRAVEHLILVAPDGANSFWWNLFLDALQLPHSFSQGGVIPIGEGCEVRVHVVQETDYEPEADTEEQRFRQLAQWLQGNAACSVEDLMRWLDG
ncbi:MAG: UvrD-helicase domain-containing protein [Armatimonadota bacterium]|nr:UvrD-helicase domain-containing protein [bacterium]MDW8319869.1 UvrD-helicase domain-containing protein [Armatimonadota bacterium]